MSTPFSYLNVVEFLGDVTDVDATEGLTEYQKWHLHQKCQLLSCALRLAREKMAISKNWDDICNQAVETLKKFSMTITRSSRVVRNWYQQFRKQRKFSVRCTKKHSLPPFLQQNQDVCMKLQTYAREHLSELSVELLLEYLLETVLPSMVKETSGVEKRAVSQEQYTAEAKKILSTYGLTCIDPSTVYRWLQKLGFRYEPRRKG